MVYNNSEMRTRCFFIIFSLIFLLPLFFVYGQTQGGEAILTWEVESYIPQEFRGRALPVNGSMIRASVEILSSKKIVNASSLEISWYIDGVFFRKGVGLQTISFPATKVGGGSHSVRVVARASSQNYEGLISIPIFNPVVVIENAHPLNILKQGESALIRAFPYFFNTSTKSNVFFFWKINNEKQDITTDPEIVVNIGTPKNESQKKMTIEVVGQNVTNKLESGSDKRVFTIQ